MPALLQDLAALTLPHEIIVADGGSTDGTRELAAGHGARVVCTARGRGRQLRAGVSMAAGDWLLVVHADARLSRAALAAAEAAMGGSGVQAACWPLAIAGHGWRFRFIEWGAALRWRLTGLAYGDQGLVVRRSLYEAAGGYPDTTIMEDVVLVRRLARLARVYRLGERIVVDPRRWRREGQLRGTARNALLLALFLAGVGPERLARWYRPEPRAS